MRIAADVPPRQRLTSPALIIVDMQNDFVRETAPLEVAHARRTIEPIRRLLSGFRTRNLPVVYTRFLSLEEPNLLWHWSPECWPETKCCWAGHLRKYPDRDEALDCAGIIDEIHPEPDDLIVDKYGYGAFHDTTLNAYLRSRSVQSLVITGTVTQICVEETAREAFHHGYLTTMVSDGVSSFSPQLHEATLTNFAMKFGWVSETRSILACL